MKKTSSFLLALGGFLAIAACKSSSGTSQQNIENENLTIEGAFEQVGDNRAHLVFAKNGTFFATYASERVEGRYTATHTFGGPTVTLSLKTEETIDPDPTPVVDAGKDTGTKSDAGGTIADAGKSDAAAKDAGIVTPDPGQTNGDEVFGELKLTKYEFILTGKHGTLVLRNDSGTRQYKKLASYCTEASDCSTQGLKACSTAYSCSARACVCGKAGDAGTPKSDAGK